MEKKFTEELNELIRTKRMHRQWADKGINFITGCGNQCKYCYCLCDGRPIVVNVIQQIGETKSSDRRMWTKR